MRDINELTLAEMTKEEHREFRKRWIADYSSELVLEIGMDTLEARQSARKHFDSLGRKWFECRDEQILARRARER